MIEKWETGGIEEEGIETFCGSRVECAANGLMGGELEGEVEARKVGKGWGVERHGRLLAGSATWSEGSSCSLEVKVAMLGAEEYNKVGKIGSVREMGRVGTVAASVRRN